MTRDAEHIEQSMLFQWAALAEGKYPELHWMYAVPNFAGHHGSKVARLRSGARAKAEGRKKGVPDVVLPAARGEYHGLYIEMKDPVKRPKRDGAGGVQPEQREWHAYLRGAGYAVFVCYTWEDARDLIVQYLELAPGRRLSVAA